MPKKDTSTKRHADFMVEVRECHAEWQETRNPDAARRMLQAQAKGDVVNFKKAKEESLGRVVDAEGERRDLVRRLNVQWKKEE